MATISGTINHSITLSSSGAYASPLIITPTGSVSNNGTGDAIYGPAGSTTWDIYNQGQISATGAFDAIDLAASGSIVNIGTIGGEIYLRAGGNVTNIHGIGAATNALVAGGISLQADGTITNGGNSDVTALIAGAVGSAGVTIGTIGGNGGFGGFGVSLSGGGAIANFGTVASGAGGAGSSPTGQGGNGGAGGTGIGLSGAGGISNTGRIFGGGGGAGGNTGGSGGSTRGGNGGIGGAGLNLSGGGTVTNSGTIIGGTGGSGGLGPQRHGYEPGLGGDGGAGIAIANSGSIDNLGTIAGGTAGLDGNGNYRSTAGIGIVLNAGGLVTNGASGGGGLIKGGTGVRALGAVAATVINYGIIASFNGAGTAVSFANAGSLLILEGGSTLIGKAVGVGGTLDLAAAGGNGFLSGLGSQFTGFAYYAVLAGASWSLSGTNTIASGKTLANSGTLTDSGLLSNAGNILRTGSAGVGIQLNGGSLTNEVGALVSAGGAGVSAPTSVGFVTNAGTIHSASSRGIYLGDGGTVTNSGLIDNISTVSAAVSFLNVNAAFGNSGTVRSSGNTGVYFGFGGALTNAVGGLITGGYAGLGVTGAGVVITNKGLITGGAGIVINKADTAPETIVNYGSITGAGGTAIAFGSGNDLLLIEPGSELTGALANFHSGDTIDLVGVVANSDTYSNDILTCMDGSTTVATLRVPGNFTSASFQLGSDGKFGTDITTTLVCFCRGTLIQTARGEVPVEELAVGDRVRTLAGRFKPIRWIGLGRSLVTRANKLARPIIVRRGALADDVPSRDLYLTHGHSLYFAGEQALIPVEHLVNHRSILWDQAARAVEYYHIELSRHEVIWANGAPAESYHDASNRAWFQNTRPGSKAHAAKSTFAPVLQACEIVENVWARLFARAGGQFAENTTADPDLHLVVDGARLDPTASDDGVFTFVLQQPPAGPLLLRSRSGVPSLLGQGRGDHRPLGVAIERIILDQAGIPASFEHDMPQLREGGCYLPEDGFCWTDGEFALPARFIADLRGPLKLIVHTRRHGLRYPIPAPMTRAA